MLFSDFGLSEPIVRAVKDCGYNEPTPIQVQGIPAVLAGNDVLAIAQTGTGKTAAFILPMLHRLSAGEDPLPTTTAAPTKAISKPTKVQRSAIRALILAPTRELALQVEASVQRYSTHLRLKSAAIFGGMAMSPQIRQLRGRVDILVATPGRLLDHLQQGTLSLSQVEMLVLDEADRMLDMGFIRDIRRIISYLPQERQNLLFSATLIHEVKGFAASLLQDPTLIDIRSTQVTADTVAQTVYLVDRDRKHDLLTHLIQQSQDDQMLVFTRTKHGADRLVKQLSQERISAIAIHGNKTQAMRMRALAKFKQASVQILVATDIAARGIDINQLPHVVNYDLPDCSEDYIHRIGRTGRAGSNGKASSLVCGDEYNQLRSIQKLIKQSLPQEVIPGFEPSHQPSDPGKPSHKGRPRRQRRPSGQSASGGGNHPASPRKVLKDKRQHTRAVY